MIVKIKTIFNETLSGSRKGIEDVIVSMIPQTVSVVTGFATSVLIARGLGPKGMGSYALILSISGLTAALSDLGVGQTAIRFASQAAEQKDTTRQLAILRWAFRLRMLLVSLTSVIAFACAPVVANRFWHEGHLTSLVRLSLLAGIFTALAAIPTIYYQSLKRFKMNAAVSVGQTLVSLIGIVIISLLNKWSLELIIAVSIVAAGLGAFTFMFIVPKASFVALSDLPLSWAEFVKKLWYAPSSDQSSSLSLDTTGASTFAFFMLISSITVTITMRADVWLMGCYLDKSQIGLYSVASRFTLPLIIVLGALNTALWPRASLLNSAQGTTDLFKKTFRLSLITAALGTLYALTVPLLTPIIFGDIYISSILLAQLLCIRYCLAIMICPLGVIGYSFGMVRLYWWINIVQLITVVVVNIFLLPRLGSIGSAIALIINEIINIVIVGFIIRRKISTIEFSNT